MAELKFKRIEPIRTNRVKYHGTFEGLSVVKKKLDTPKEEKKVIEVPQSNVIEGPKIEKEEIKPAIKPVMGSTHLLQVAMERAEARNKPKTIVNSIDGLTAKSQASKEPWVEKDIIYGNRGESKRCVVVIPVYKVFDALKNDEKGSIRQVIKILGKEFDLVLIHPDGLDINGYNIDGYSFSTLAMNPLFFKRQKSYSNLCERWEFYTAFKDYEYMLIYQTDAWIFENKLDYFMDMDYDYIGGVHLMRANGDGGENGNGGLSLRKIGKFIEVCSTVDWTKVPYGQLEDCAFTQKFKKLFNLAPLDICFQFSWHEKGHLCYKRCNGLLPMGCHAFKKHDYYFWAKYISY